MIKRHLLTLSALSLPGLLFAAAGAGAKPVAAAGSGSGSGSANPAALSAAASAAATSSAVASAASSAAMAAVIDPNAKGAAAEEVKKDPEKAKAEENQSALTPIVPSPNNPYRPAFQLYSEIDIPVLTIGIVFASARLFRTQQPYCTHCDPSELNAFDRTTAGYWSPQWGVASDVGLYGMPVLALGLLVGDEGFLPAINDAVVVAQSALLATAVSSVLTIAAGRPRPFLYGDKAPEDVRHSSDAGNSFISGHTTVTFAVVTSTWMAMRRLHPQNSLPSTIVLVAGLAAASFVGIARVESGKHFFSDVIGGALFGSATGVLIPALHSAPVRVVPQLGPQGNGFAIVGAF